MPHSSKEIRIDEKARALAEFFVDMHRAIEDLRHSTKLVREQIEAMTLERGARDAKEVIDTYEAAALAGVKPRTIRAWVQNGRLRPIGRGRTYLFRRRDVLGATRAPVRKRRRELLERRLRRRKEEA